MGWGWKILFNMFNLLFPFFVGVLGLGNSDFIAATMDNAARSGSTSTLSSGSLSRTRQRRPPLRQSSSALRSMLHISPGPPAGSFLLSSLGYSPNTSMTSTNIGSSLTSGALQGRMPMTTGVGLSKLRKMMEDILQKGRRWKNLK